MGRRRERNLGDGRWRDEALLARLERFARRSGWSDRRIGLALGLGTDLLYSLRRGRDMRFSTRERVLVWVEDAERALARGEAVPGDPFGTRHGERSA